MRYLFILLFVLLSGSVLSQGITTQDSPSACVESFFEFFHKQDTTRIKSLIHDDIVVGTIKGEGLDTALIIEDIQRFYLSLASIPDSMDFKEVLQSMEVKSDGMLAQVWTPYTFYLDGNVLHNGINAFTLINEGGIWKIIQLVDTRRKIKDE